MTEELNDMGLRYAGLFGVQKIEPEQENIGDESFVASALRNESSDIPSIHSG